MEGSTTIIKPRTFVLSFQVEGSTNKIKPRTFVLPFQVEGSTNVIKPRTFVLPVQMEGSTTIIKPRTFVLLVQMERNHVKSQNVEKVLLKRKKKPHDICTTSPNVQQVPPSTFASLVQMYRKNYLVKTQDTSARAVNVHKIPLQLNQGHLCH